jgi:pimeloyl-ACP methyl ester carboxylesterase
MKSLFWGYTTLLLLFVTPLSASEFPPAPGQRIDVGGYNIHIHCVGNGQPTVIIDAGLGDDSTDWQQIQLAAANETTVCVYDRPGYGWSDFGPKPRSSLRIASELNKVIQKAHLQGPFILVGHSFGGFNMRVFASQYPQSVAGLVLVDASHEQQYKKLNIKLPEKDDRKGNILVLPKHISTTSEKAVALRERAYHAASSEISALFQSAKQVEKSKVELTVPLIVISRGKPEWTRTAEAAYKERIWVRLQQELSTLSPLSQHVFAHQSGHDIHLDQPEIVTQAITDVVHMARVMK